MKVILFGAGNIGSMVLEGLKNVFNVEPLLIDSVYPKTFGENFVCLPITETSIYDSLLVNNMIGPGMYVINAMPHATSKIIAKWAAEKDCHYFDFTEDVQSRDYIKSLAHSHPNVLLAPGQGLAPGMINIMGATALQHALDSGWTDINLKLRVGALNAFVDNRFNYVFTWSPDGVVNEYLNSDTALIDGYVIKVQGMSRYERLHLDGTDYEAFVTSGGLGTLLNDFAPEIEDRQVSNMTYKSIRNVGHHLEMTKTMYEFDFDRENLLAYLLENIPFKPDNDYVVTYVSVTGKEGSRLLTQSYYRRFNRNAIRRTTAYGLLATMEMHHRGLTKSSGFLTHREISFKEMAKTNSWKSMSSSVHNDSGVLTP